MLVVVIAAPEDEGLFHPDQTMAITKATILEALDEVFEEEARHRRVDDGPGHGVLPSNYQNGAGTMWLGKMPRLSAEGLQLLSSEIEAGVGRFVDGQDWAVPIKTADPGLPVISRSGRRQTIELGRDRGKSIVVASWRSPSPARTLLLSFHLAAQELVASAHEFLAKCPGCAMVFVRDDMRQTYCTARCNTVSRMRKHRSRKRGQPTELPPKPSYTFTFTPHQYKSCKGQAYGKFDVALASYRGASQTLSNYSAFGYPYTKDVNTISLGPPVTLSGESILLNVFSGGGLEIEGTEGTKFTAPKGGPSVVAETSLSPTLPYLFADVPVISPGTFSPYSTTTATAGPAFGWQVIIPED